MNVRYVHARVDPINVQEFRNNLLLLYKNLPPDRRTSTIIIRKIFDAISALRFLFQGAFKDFWAVLRAHRAYYGMKNSYRGTNKKNKTAKNNVIVSGIYPGSIVLDFFLRGRSRFEQLDGIQKIADGPMNQGFTFKK